MAKFKPLSNEKFIEKMKGMNKDIEALGTYVDSKSPILFHCLKHNIVWNAQPNNILQGRGCPKCKNDRLHDLKAKSMSQYKKELESLNIGMTCLDEYKNIETPIKHFHANCGQEFYCTPRYILYHKHCPKCYEHKKSSLPLTKEEHIKILSERSPNMELLGEYVNARTKTKYKYKDCGHVAVITPMGALLGNSCAICASKRVGQKLLKSNEQFKKELDDKDIKFSPITPYIGANKEITIKCIKCGKELTTTPHSILNNRITCPKCSIKSKGESIICYCLKKYHINYEQQKRYRDLRGVGGKPLPYDIYIPCYNILVEFQGEQHEHAVEMFGGEKLFKIRQQHDQMKRDYAKAHSINLLEIWYYDIENIEEILTKHLNLESVETAASDSVTN